MKATQLLLVDDNEINQGLMKEILTRDGYEVTFANHGREALDLLAKQDFTAILMDLKMPVMDGYEAISHIRKIERFKHLPVIALSAVMQQDEIEKALHAGFDYHLGKPIDFGKLQHILGQINQLNPQDRLGRQTASIQLNADLVMDLPSALKNHDQDKDLLDRLLNEFNKYYKLADADMESLISQQENELAERLAHNIAGVAGSFGAHALMASSKQLETSLRDMSDDIQTPLAEFTTQLQKFLREVQSYLGATNKPGS